MTLSSRRPAEPGDPIDSIETPSLLVDVDLIDENIRRMAVGAGSAGVALRPHAKSHKCAAIARRQIAAGAIGICCQKVSEAEAMVAGGIRDIYVSNEVIASRKLMRLAYLARHARISLAFDSSEGVTEASRCASAAGVVLEGLVELDLGDGRSGVAPGDAALNLARAIASADGLRFVGLQCYKAMAQHAATTADRRRISLSAAAIVAETVRLLADSGLACTIVTGGGTGSWSHEAGSGVYTEVQPGSYVFMDAYYGRIAGHDGTPFNEFEHSLTLLATVTSTPASGRAMVDAGSKALEIGYGGLPMVVDRPGTEYYEADDEHGRIRWSEGARPLLIGDRIRLIPGNCDPTVNLHDWLVGVRGGRVELVWPIDARGPGY